MPEDDASKEEGAPEESTLVEDDASVEEGARGCGHDVNLGAA